MNHIHKFTNVLCMILLVTGMISFAAQKKIEAFLEPEEVYAGETAYLVIRSNDGARNAPQGQLPSVSGLRWLGGMSQSSRVSIVNGKRTSSYEVRIPFTADKEGSYRIPALTLTHAGEKTPPISFTVKKNSYRSTSGNSGSASGKGETLPLEEVTNMSIAVPGKRKFYYLGEEVPLEIDVNILRGAQVELSWPKIIFGRIASAVLLDQSKTHPANPNFSGTRRFLRRIGKREYITYRFSSAFRPVTAGDLRVSAEENAILLVPDERRSSRTTDDFFDSFWDSGFFNRQRRVARNMKSSLLSVQIRKLPPVPQGMHFTGLVGNWKSKVTLSAPPYRVGEPLTVTVQFDSSSSSAMLRAPRFSNTHFRAYTPEVERTAAGVVIRYILIPTARSDGKKINLKLGPWATFDPVKGKYSSVDFAKALVVERNTSAILPGNSMPVVVDSAAEKTQKALEKEKARPREEVLYLKKSLRGDVTLPLWKNKILEMVLILFAGVILLLSVSILRLRRSLRDRDGNYLRFTRAKKGKKALLKKIQRCEDHSLARDCSGDIASYLADVLALAPGSDLEECAQALETRSPELAEMLRTLGKSAWQPQAEQVINSAFRERLLKLLGRLCVFFLILLPAALPGGEKLQEKKPPVVIRTDAQAMSAYDNGHFQEACRYYKSRICDDKVSASALYNLGNCYYKMGQYPPALICYERALRLDSRDPDIVENLNLVRRKLALKEVYKMNTPADTLPYLRDMLRLDEWLLMIFMGLGTLFAAGAFFLWNGDSKSFRLILSLGICWALLSFWAYMAQCKSVYDPDRALVMAQTLKVYSLPSEEAGKVEMTLRSGEEVYVVERRMEWVRIRSGNAEGWVRAGGIMSLWNPDSMKDLVSHQ